MEEIIAADPAKRLVQCWKLIVQGYSETPGSRLLGIRASDLSAQIDWPSARTAK